MTISIITVVYNAAHTITETVQSVLKQDYPIIEYVVLDGASTDGTVAILENHKTKFSYYHSKPDAGLYDAMNQAMQYCTGDFCLFLNAGDVFYEATTLSQLAAQITKREQLYFSTAVLTDRRTMYRLIPPEQADIESWLTTALPNHQTLLFPRSFYLKNKYNTDYRISADDDFKVRALQQYPIQFIPIWSVLFEMGGLSSSYQKFPIVQRRIKELYRLYAEHYPNQKMTVHKFALKSYFIYLMSKILPEEKLIRQFNKFNRIPKGDHVNFLPFVGKKNNNSPRAHNS